MPSPLLHGSSSPIRLQDVDVHDKDLLSTRHDVLEVTSWKCQEMGPLVNLDCI